MNEEKKMGALVNVEERALVEMVEERNNGWGRGFARGGERRWVKVDMEEDDGWRALLEVLSQHVLHGLTYHGLS